MVGRLLSCWNGKISGAMLNFQGVLVVDLEFDEFLNMEVFFIKNGSTRSELRHFRRRQGQRCFLVVIYFILSHCAVGFRECCTPFRWWNFKDLLKLISMSNLWGNESQFDDCIYLKNGVGKITRKLAESNINMRNICEVHMFCWKTGEVRTH